MINSFAGGSNRPTAARDAAGDGLTNTERNELRLLRAENKTLRMERDLLGKAVASAGSSPT
jgi:hypothetical protein